MLSGTHFGARMIGEAGKTPMEVFFELDDKTPLWEDIEAR